MMDQEQTMQALGRVFAHYGVGSMDELKQTEAWKKVRAEAETQSPSASGIDHDTKAIQALMVAQTTGDLECFVVEARYVSYGQYDKEARDNLPEWVGILLLDAGGSTHRVKMRDWEPGVDNWDGFPNLRRAQQVLMTNVVTTHNLEAGTVSVRQSKDTKVVASEHGKPFPEGPGLAHICGDAARLEGTGAWARDKKKGTVRGEWGTYAKGPRTLRYDVPDTDAIKIRAYDDMKPEEQHAAVRFTTHDGVAASTKIPLDLIAEQWGISRQSPPETFAATIAGKRVLARGVGGIFLPLEADKFADGALEKRVAELTESGLVKMVGKQGNIPTLDFSSVPDEKVSEDGQSRVKRMPEDYYIKIGDRNVYQVGVEKGKLKASVLAKDLGNVPWFNAWPKSGTSKREDGSDNDWEYNPHGFILFLDSPAATGDGSVPDSNPWKQMMLAEAGNATPAPTPTPEPNGDPEPATAAARGNSDLGGAEYDDQTAMV